MVNDKIFFQPSGSEKLFEFSKTPYQKETVLQKALQDAPEVIVGFTTTGAEPTRLLLIRREMKLAPASSAGAFHIDHLYADTSAVPVLVEVKRSSDTRLRREVVAQMLDYAASAAQEWTAQVISQALEDRAGPNTSVDELLYDHDISMSAELFVSTMTDNLISGRIRMMFVADEIPESLHRIIEFLNAQMSPAEILGVEVPQYVGHGGTAYVPRLVGRTSAARTKKLAAGAGQQWDRDSFLEEVTDLCSDSEYALILQLLAHADKHGTVVWGQGAQAGFGAWYNLDGQPVGLWNLRAPSKEKNLKGRIESRFSDLLKTRGYERVDAAATQLQKIKDASERIKAVREAGLKGWPSIYLSDFVGDANGAADLLAAVNALMSSAS